MNLRWTDAGRAALADAANVGTAALRLAHFAIGDGHGPGGEADDGRAALRSERDRAAVTGTVATDGRIAFRADFTPADSYGITEAGVFGTVGDPAGPLTLYLYWTDGGVEAGRVAAGTRLAIASVIEFQAAAADVAVTVSPAIEFGDLPEEATESEFGLTRYADATEAADATEGERAVTPQRMHGVAGKVLGGLVAGGPADGTVYQLVGQPDGTLVVQARTQDAATAMAIQNANTAIMANATAIQALQGKTGDASTAQKGIVELATQAELETGTDEGRVPAVKTIADALGKLVGGLKDPAPTAGEKLILEGVAGGGVKVVPSPFELYRDTGAQSFADDAAVEIDDTGEWAIPSAGTYLLLATVVTVIEETDVRLQSRPSAGQWANIAGQATTIPTGLNLQGSWLAGAIFCGALAAGSSVRFTSSGGPGGQNSSTERALVIARCE